MTNSKRKGSSWETAILDYLIGAGIVAVHNPNGEWIDRGDIVRPDHGIPIEAKNERVMELAAYVDQVARASNAGGTPYGVVWMHRRGKSSPGDGYVLMDGATFARFVLAACRVLRQQERQEVAA